MPLHRGIVASGFLGVVPNPPTALTATTCANTQSVLSWTAPVNNGGSAITDYVVEYSTSATFASSVIIFADGTTDSTGATVTGLSNGTPYYFRVAAVNTYGTGSYSGISTVITPATVPNAPTSVVGTSNTNGQSSVSWVAPNGNGDGPPFVYTVQYSTSSTFASAVTTFGTTSSSSPLIVNGLTNGTTYYFRVKAANCAGDSSYSAISAGAVPATFPGAPTIGTMTLSTTNTTDSLAWSLPADGGSAITGYVYAVSTDSYVASTPTTNGLTRSQTFNPGYTTATTTVKIAAVNGVGTGPFSAASAVGFGGWANPSFPIDGTSGCPDCAACGACPACAACACGVRTSSGSRAQTGSKGTRFKTCYKWTRGAQENAGPFNEGTTSACTAAFSACTDGTCNCTNGTCACSDCSGTTTTVTTAGNYDGAYYSLTETFYPAGPVLTRYGLGEDGCACNEQSYFNITLCLGTYTITRAGCAGTTAVCK